MAVTAAEFFDALAERGHEPLLEKATGVVRFDLTNGKQTSRWVVTVKKGDVTVSRGRLDADCIVHAPQALFERMLNGETHAMASYLRGELRTEGDPQLLVLIQRLAPSPPKSRGKRAVVGERRAS